MTEDYSEIHKVVLDIYKTFKSLCEKNNLRYFAISGTTLGAVLWNGIIPWDDDMDIAMPAEDYKKFVNICRHSLPAHLAFSEFIWFGGKLHDRRTTFTNINYIHDPSRYTGIFIDIVPLIALPDDETERLSFINNLKEFQKFGLLFDRYKDSEYTPSKLNQWRNSILSAYSFGTTKYVMDFSDPRYVLSASGFLKPLIMDFEDTSIPVSSNYQEDLTIQYGKYKKYPDKKTRRSIHESQSILDPHTPYDRIAREFKNLPKWAQSMFNKKNANEGFYLKNLYYTQDLLAQSERKLEECHTKFAQTQEELSLLKERRAKSPLNILRSSLKNRKKS